MGIDVNQLTKSLGIVKHYSDSELNSAEKRVSALIQALYEVIKNERDDPLHVLTENVGLEDNPIGHILTFMGTKPPKHYLACDGTEYAIADYPMLAQHMIDQFGQVNYFGGDGETTFAVPDLRGEFLRGAGENGRNGQGNGSDVGSTSYATRPTNTSILYCIKYEPTYYLRAGSDTDYYSQEETCIGTWINGKPLYRRVVYCGDNISADVSIPCEIDGLYKVIRIWGIGHHDAGNWTLPIPYTGVDDQLVYVWYGYDNKVIRLKTSSNLTNKIDATIALEYTKK